LITASERPHSNLTLTYSSWLNQSKLWFSKIERDLLARGVSHRSPIWPGR